MEGVTPLQPEMVMKLLSSILAVVMLQIACAGLQPSPGTPDSLSAFRSEAELLAYLRGLAEEQNRGRRNRPPAMELSAMVVTGVAAANADAITNTQHQGVDEGDIVKLRGDHLVILRRGRLFTVSIRDRAMTPISATDAFGPGIDPRGAWYDELLVSDNKVVVIGFSYQRGGTEVGVFRIDPAGRLRHLATHHLRSNDYYSSRNYASRLIGGTLIFYSPLYSRLDTARLLEDLPAMRRWREGDGQGEFARIVTSRRIYRPPTSLDPSVGITFHTVTTCDLARSDLACKATVVIGPPGRVFYVSPRAVYIWTTAWRRGTGDERRRNTLYRMPLDGS